LIVTTVGFRQTAVPELHADEGTKRRVSHGGPSRERRGTRSGEHATMARPQPSALALRLRLAPLAIPEVEADNVELNGLLVGRRRGDALQHEFLLRDKRVTSIAPFVVAWAPPESRHAVIGKPAVLELLADKETDRWGFHDGLCIDQAAYPCPVKNDHMVRVEFSRALALSCLLSRPEDHGR
jgi:hypothetical protein